MNPEQNPDAIEWVRFRGEALLPQMRHERQG